MKLILFFSFLLLSFFPCSAQEEEPIDTTKTLDEVTVRAFEQNRSLKSTISLVKVITDYDNGDRNNKTSLVNGLNTVAGVRMEERSPGSYRINIRGSSLRSPFGVRNVKVYWNDLPVTDAGGNTYFNQLAYNNFAYLEVYKGPAASMYGAGTGGLILLHSFNKWQPGISAEYVTGSYNLQNIFLSGRYGKKENMSQLSFAHNQVNGYREQSRLRRDNFSWVSKFKISQRQQITTSILFTDMYYQTPGALTQAEFNNDPTASRPAAGVLPSAVKAKAAIHQLNFLAGFNHFYKFTPHFTNQTIFYGSLAEINNPAIRNYERRSEPGFGSRSIFVYERKKEYVQWKLLAGGEFQHAFFNTIVFSNKDGKPDSLQTNDDINYRVRSYFTQGDLNLDNKWFFSAGISLNKTRVGLTRLSEFPVITQRKVYREEIAPRFAVKRMITDDFALRATISRGFSPPTVAELLPSTGMISTHLEAEYGWNYELMMGYDALKNRLRLELTGFYFKLNNALVQRRDSSGADYFVNAGDVRQKGIEVSSDYYSDKIGKAVDHYRFNLAYTYNHFRYGSFIRSGTDYSGKTIPSVPVHTLSALADFYFRNNLYTNFTWYSASNIFLNDANTFSAPAYHLLGARIGWKKILKNNSASANYKLSFYIGADNLLDEVYSLGNDINAAANRYYNAAPRRNYYAGVSFQWIKTPRK